MTAREYKEFRYFDSSALNVEVQLSVARMDLPSAVRVGQFPPNIAPDLADGNAHMIVPDEVVISAYIVCNQTPMHEVPVSTRLCMFDEKQYALVWDAVLAFPIKFKDLTLNSRLVLTASTPAGELLGGTTMEFYDEKQRLKMGKQKLMFFLRQQPDAHLESTTRGEEYDKYKDSDYAFQVEKLFEQYKLERVSRMDWLDRVTLQRLEDIIRELTAKESQVEEFSLSDQEAELRSSCTITIELPSFHFPVVHEDRTYGGVGAVASLGHPDLFELGLATINAAGTTITFDNMIGRPFPGSCMAIFADWDMEVENASEDKYRKLAREALRGVADPHLKPNRQEKETLDSIINQAGDHIKNSDKDLLWRFRYTLTENNRALTKFLLSVDWNSESEVSEALSLLQHWKAKAPIDVADALKLLGREKAFTHEAVRAYAVETLEKASDHELLTFLLQLVQALRYEPVDPDQANAAGETDGVNEAYVSPLARFLISRAKRSLEVANFLYWYLTAEKGDATHGAMYQNILKYFMRSLEEDEESARIGKLLRAQASYLHKIGQCQVQAREEKGRKDQKEECMRRLLIQNRLDRIHGEVDAVPNPLQPSTFFDGLLPKGTFMFKSATYPAVVEFLLKPQEEATESKQQQKEEDGAAGEGTEDDADERTQRMKNSQAKLAKMVGVDADEVGVLVSNRDSVRVIFKSGDDMRQDQLIMQMIMLMDQLLKKVNMDLKLRPYGILATGKKDGIMEFVAGSAPVSHVLANNNQSILAYLKKHNPDPNGPMGVSARAIETFVKSCAGYCVITFILGIGDRHLDNIMMLPEGNLFHIDFGFIFGRDPKPLPPPFRFTRHMADAMGGEDSEYYQRFKAYCCQAYNWLRKSANLILNLLNLMVDAGIAELSTDPAATLAKVEEKFRLDLTDELAEQYFLGLINESLNALAPKMMEYFHQISVAIK